MTDRKATWTLTPTRRTAQTVALTILGAAAAWITTDHRNITHADASPLGARRGSTLPPIPDTSDGTAVAGGPRYTVAEIRLPYELSFGALFINSLGDVAGTLQKPGRGGSSIAFYYHAGQTTTLGEASGRNGNSHAMGLNDHGQVLLQRYASAQNPQHEALIWKNGTLTPIGPVSTALSSSAPSAPSPTSPSSPREAGQAIPNVGVAANSINNAGQVVGSLLSPQDEGMGIPWRPFLWQRGVLTFLDGRTSPLIKLRPTYSPFAIGASAINDSDEIVGGGDNGWQQIQGRTRSIIVIWDAKSARTVERQSQYDVNADSPNVASLPIELSEPIHPRGINNHGVWVGERVDEFIGSTYSNVYNHACFGSGQKNDIHDLDEEWTGSSGIAARLTSARLTSARRSPNRQSAAYGVNDSGQIVGNVSDDACLWQNGKGINLNDLIDKNLGIRLDNAYGINKTGQIVATGWHTARRAYILTPITK